MGIYFVRHGQTDWNVAGKLQGKSDIPLNDVGETQAKETREKLKDVKIDKIYCSPLIRAQKTAEIINEGRNLEIHKDDRLMERCFGRSEGIHREDVDFSNLWIPSKDTIFDGGEDTISFFQRVESFLDEIIEDAQTSNILVVAHGGVAIPFQCYFDGYDCVDNLSTLIIANCEVWHKEGKKLPHMMKI